MTTEQFDNLDKMLSQAADQKNPEMLKLQWLVVLKEPMLAKVNIEVIFITEQKLETEEMNLLNHDKSGMFLSISGVSKEWVDRVFKTINPFIESSKLSGIYKPLLIFRNDSVVSYLSYSLGGFLYAISWYIVDKLDDSSGDLEKILSKPNLEEQFEQYIKYIFTNDSLLFTIISIIIPLSILIVSPFLLMAILPNLVPKSVIAIGLAKKRFAKYQNAFKFLVFSVLFTGILLPLLIGIIVNLIT